jgi:tetratricopeptide (TPR) repeat protein
MKIRIKFISLEKLRQINLGLSYTPSTSSKLGDKINPVLKASNQAAVDAYNSKNYAVAGDKFKETYYLLKASGTDDKSILMNAAISYATADKLPESISLYNELINSGYTGIETTYTAKNKKTGVVDKLDKSSWDLFQKMGAAGDYTDFKTETSKSVEKDLYTINAKNLYNTKRYDEAIALADKGLAKFPNDNDLMNIKGLSFYGSGKSAEFIDILKKQVAANPNDADSWFNLGVMQSKDEATRGDAEKDFNKAVEIKPNYSAAWQNLTQMKIGDDDKARADYAAARKAGKIELANKILDARKTRFLTALPYAEKWYASSPDDLGAVSLLKNLYMMANNDTKTAEFKAKEAALKAKEAK